jgi:hypothetical protein
MSSLSGGRLPSKAPLALLRRVELFTEIRFSKKPLFQKTIRLRLCCPIYRNGCMHSNVQESREG